jgi:tetratricopeptide (TPR) repeat protein
VHPRNRTIAWLILALVPAFALTGMVTRMYREHERTLAAEWAERAHAARRRGDPATAVSALQSALRFAPGDRDYTYRLAGALRDDGRPTEARAYLLGLWESEPGNGPVNLELGRLSARDRDTGAALRYYHNAIEGSWREAAELNRRTARLELARYLLAAQEPARAQAELIPLAAELPRDTSVATDVGELLLAAGDHQRARAVFESLLVTNRAQPAVLTGAGEAAFQAGDYAAAARYLERALRAGAADARLKEKASVARAVVESDPFQARLTTAQRAVRARTAFDRSATLLDRCAALDGFRPALEALRPRLTPRALRRDSDLIEETLETVFRVETAASTSCASEITAADTALLLIGRRRFGA